MQSETGTHKVSDSGYSNSCSNSQSQRSGSSKSRNSGSNSSRSSGYCGGSGRHPTTSSTEVHPNEPKPISKRIQEPEHKNKKLKNTVTPFSDNGDTIIENVINNPPATIEIAEPTQLDVKDVETWAPPNIDDSILPPVENVPELQKITEEFTTESQDVTNVDIDETASLKTIKEPGDGFYCVISMHDGVVLYTTPNLTNVLDFPQDMWLGRSFIDFVHPKDRVTFASHITADVAIPLAENQGQIKECTSNSLYVSLRKYRGLRSSGFGVMEKAVTFRPFHLSLVFKEIKPQVISSTNKGLYLIVSATPLHSPYKIPDEPFLSTKFCVRHTASCEISYVDPGVVANFGFLPQDMLGHSIFEFLHPEDMPFLKEVYKNVMENTQVAGSVFRSKPYRFLTQNGSFVTIETDWSCFINPWIRKLEFVIGHHRIIQGPQNPQIFEAPRTCRKQFHNEIVTKSNEIQAEIRYLLISEVPRPDNSAKQQVSKRCKDLASFMETLMDDVKKTNEIKVNVPSQEIDPTFSERGSPMLGEISPHHDYCDSKSSSETPPSYNQLNYNENMQRFFESKPNTRAQSDTAITEMDVDRKNIEPPTLSNRKHLSPLQTSGDSGSGSVDNSSGSNPKMNTSQTASRTTNSNLGKQPTLTEELLFRHNEDMEKIMAKKHREHRSGTKGDKIKFHKMRGVEKHDPHEQGVKRSGSHSWESDYHKQPKHKHNMDSNNVKTNPKINPEPVRAIHNALNTPVAGLSSSNVQPGTSNTGLQNFNSLWPPFSLTLPQMQTIPTTQVPTTTTYPTGGMLLYVPPQTQPDQSLLSSAYPFHCVSGFQPFYHSTPMMYPPGLAFLQPIPIPVSQAHMTPNAPQINNNNHLRLSDNTTYQSHPLPAQQESTHNLKPRRSKSSRPISQPTSIKAEPGSAMGISATNSITNRDLSECCKHDLSVQSISSNGSLQMDQEKPDCTSSPNLPLSTQPEPNPCVGSAGSLDDESSSSSFYSSLLKTDVSNGNNTNSDNSKDKQSSCSRNFEKTKKSTNQHIRRKATPPWLEAVHVTPELVYQYQMTLKDADAILEADLLLLKEVTQPMLVNDQLGQLYLDLELEGLSRKLSLEESITTSSSSSDESSVYRKTTKSHYKRRSYSKIVMIYEADAPFPPPDA